jgi:hypothetical protein
MSAIKGDAGIARLAGSGALDATAPGGRDPHSGGSWRGLEPAGRVAGPLTGRRKGRATSRDEWEPAIGGSQYAHGQGRFRGDRRQ